MKVYTPKPGNDWNPLAKGKFKNFACPCGSDLKVKKCCGTVSYMEEGMAASLKSLCALGTKEAFQGTSDFNKKRRADMIAEAEAKKANEAAKKIEEKEEADKKVEGEEK